MLIATALSEEVPIVTTDRHFERYRGLKVYVDIADWWTGKDSNLRTSQGGTDLQSVGFNHSPTCPERTCDEHENNTKGQADSRSNPVY